MRIPSGVTDQYVYFVAVDSTDFTTRETGLSSFTVYRSRNGGAAAAMTTPTINETDSSNMPGVYELLLDEDMTIDSGDDEQEMVFHITHAGMAPVTRAVTLFRPKITAGETLTTSSGVASANATQISGDSTAADNLEAMYDGTGYTDETGPASRAQVDGIGSGSGGSIPFEAVEDNTGGAIDPSSATFVGSVNSGTFADTQSQDGTPHDIADTGNDIDIVYGFQVGGGRVGVQAKIFANVNGNADEIKVKAYDHVGADWEIIATLEGSGGSTYVSLEPTLFQKHTGTGSEIGKVYIRFETDSTTPSGLQVDQCVVLAANLGQSVGYALGAIWIDTNNGTSGTESFVNGVADNPVDSLADALTIASAIGLSRFVIAAGSSITLTGAATNYELMGDNWTLAFGGQSIAGAKITGATVSGTFTGTTAILNDCIINAITGPGITMRSCYFNEVTITNNGTAGWYLNDCRSRVAGTGTCTFDFGAGVGDTNVSVRSYSGGIEVENMGDTGTDRMSIEGMGQIVLNANCDGGTLAMRGIFRMTDNSGNVNVVRTDPTATQVDQGTAQSGSANSITLAATASATDGQYDPGTVYILNGTGAGQARGILDYNGTTKVATVDKDWRTNPDSSSSYIVITKSGEIHVNEGAAQGGASTTITLNAAASATDDIYIGQTVFLVGGTGQDQARIITDYNGTTKVATVHRAWDTNPASGTSYIVLPLPTVGDAIVDILTDTGTTLPATLSTIDGKVDDVQGATFDTSTDSLEAIRNRGDAAWTTGGGGSSTIVEIRGAVAQAGSTYYVSFVVLVNGVMQTSGLSSLVTTFHDEDGTDLTYSGTPSDSSGFISSNGTLGTGITNNRPVLVKVGATYGGTAYTSVLPAVAIA